MDLINTSIVSSGLALERAGVLRTFARGFLREVDGDGLSVISIS